MLDTLREQFPMGETILIALIILLVTWIIERIIFKTLQHLGRSKNNPLPASSIFANIARVIIWLFGIAALFKICFNYDITAFVAALGVGGIAISLGFQDTLLNLIGGLQVSIGKLVQPGEYVEVLEQRGRVTDVSWRHTTIVDFNGKTHMIPNSLMNKNSLIDLGESGQVRVPFLVPLETDIDAFTKDVTSAVESSMEGQLGERGVDVRFAGEIYAGLSGNVVVDVLWSAYTPEMAVNMISRAIDQVLKHTGITV